jgi:hypothetical protein
MDKKKYLITMKYEFEAFDDVEARMMLTDLLEKGKVSFGMKEEIKLQNILDNKEPRKIEI